MVDRSWINKSRDINEFMMGFIDEQEVVEGLPGSRVKVWRIRINGIKNAFVGRQVVQFP